MKSINLCFCLALFVLFSGCKTEPELELVELRENFSEAEFENAIIGTWNSVHEREGEANVLFLSINNDQKAMITIEENSLSVNYDGDLTVEFLRPTSPTMITLAKLTITTAKEEIVLTNVYFGLNNFIPEPEEGELYLRNGFDPPYATLQREVN